MNDDDDTIPSVEDYRGVPIHAEQPRDRIEKVVKPEIDRVHDIKDCRQLAKIAGDFTWAPEARLFAKAKVEAALALAAERRLPRPKIDLRLFHASAPSLGRKSRRRTEFYCSVYEPIPPLGYPRPVKREVPLR